eukprot:COSAG02_NODE_3912_length_6053_cov_3.520155_2_plen_147_part_00
MPLVGYLRMVCLSLATSSSRRPNFVVRVYPLRGRLDGLYCVVMLQHTAYKSSIRSCMRVDWKRVSPGEHTLLCTDQKSSIDRWCGEAAESATGSTLPVFEGETGIALRCCANFLARSVEECGIGWCTLIASSRAATSSSVTATTFT